MEILVAKNLKMPKQLSEQYFCHYQELEEYHAGMWRRIPPEMAQVAIESVLDFMGNTECFADAMHSVCEEWNNSCRYNFTSSSTNHVAWLGQAAVCYATGHPESITRRAWALLPKRRQIDANAAAREAISIWRNKNSDNEQWELFNGI